MTTPAPPLTEACSYCHGVRLVGWSGAGPILCPECSRGENAFTVITQAWREQRAKVRALESELDRLRREKAELTEALTEAQTKLQAAEHVAAENGIALTQMTGQWNAACDLVQHREELEGRRDEWLTAADGREMIHSIGTKSGHTIWLSEFGRHTGRHGPTYEAALAAALEKVSAG